MGAVASIVLLGILGGCAETTILAQPPRFDQKTLEGLTTIKADTDALLGKLQAPSPDCLASNNTMGFEKLAGDILAAKTQAETVLHNDHTVKGISNLGDSTSHFRAAASGGAVCLPATIVKTQQTQLDTATQRLIDYEQAKPH
jgi:hypothetical protein